MQKLAIVATVSTANDNLMFFVRYHLNLGFHYIFLFFDGSTDETITRFEIPGVIVTANDSKLREQWQSLYGYRSNKKYIENHVIVRQRLNAQLALKRSLDLEIDWLLHIDCDELFYCHGTSVSDHFKQLTEQGIINVRYVNHEAIPEKIEIVNIFEEVSLFKRNPNTLSGEQSSLVDAYSTESNPYFNFYANGKSAVRIDKSVVAIGPHGFANKGGLFSRFFRFRTVTDVVRSGDASILHYSCCGFDEFWTKYKILGRFPDKWLDKLQISSLVPIHTLSRDICSLNDVYLAKIFYERIFINTPFRNREIFLRNGICFDVRLGS